MHSRAVSARSAGFTPARRQTVRLKNSTTQTEEVVDIESADPEQLFSDDIADGPLRQSYSDYQQAENGKYEVLWSLIVLQRKKRSRINFFLLLFHTSCSLCFL